MFVSLMIRLTRHGFAHKYSAVGECVCSKQNNKKKKDVSWMKRSDILNAEVC